MPDLAAPSKKMLNTKGQFEAFMGGALAAALVGKPVLRQALDGQINSLKSEIDKLPETKPRGVSGKPPVNRNDNLIGAIDAQYKEHWKLVGRYSYLLKIGKESTSIELEIDESLKEIEALGKQWDQNEKAFESETSEYDELKEQYGQFAIVRQVCQDRLFDIVRVYNRNYHPEENLGAYSHEAANAWVIENFYVGEGYKRFKPTQHAWFDQGGPNSFYNYDFQNNGFQLHIHSDGYNGDIRESHVKRVGKQIKSSMKFTNTAAAQYFRDTYAPQAPYGATHKRHGKVNWKRVT